MLYRGHTRRTKDEIPIKTKITKSDKQKVKPKT